MTPQRIPTVAALVIRDDKVLLVRHGEAARHMTGVYGLPGGRLDENESLLDGAAREFQEETGLIPDKSSMIKIPTTYEADIPRKGGEVLSVTWDVFLVKKYSGEIMKTTDVDETIPEWVDINKISGINLLPNTQNAIKEAQDILPA